MTESVACLYFVTAVGYRGSRLEVYSNKRLGASARYAVKINGTALAKVYSSTAGALNAGKHTVDERLRAEAV